MFETQIGDIDYLRKVAKNFPKKRPYVYPFLEMKVGETFIIPTYGEYVKVKRCVAAANLLGIGSFYIQTIYPTDKRQPVSTFKVWRLA